MLMLMTMVTRKAIMMPTVLSTNWTDELEECDRVWQITANDSKMSDNSVITIMIIIAYVNYICICSYLLWDEDLPAVNGIQIEMNKCMNG